VKAIILTGSRYLNDSDRVLARLNTYDRGTVVLHGDNPGVKSRERTGQRGAPGADRIGHAMAMLLGHVPVPFPADWTIGKRGGPERNELMLRTLLSYREHGWSIAVEAFPLPNSIGTLHMIGIARRERVFVTITGEGA